MFELRDLHVPLHEKALDFSVLADIRPMIEVVPLEDAAHALARMKSGDVRFRMVLTMPH